MKRFIKNTEKSPKFNYTFVEGFQDSSDIEIFGGEQTSFIAYGKKIHKVKWDSDDIPKIESTIELLKGLIQLMTRAEYDKHVVNDTEEVWTEYAEDICERAKIDVFGRFDFLRNYFQINEVIKTIDILSDEDKLYGDIRKLISPFDNLGYYLFGVGFIMKVHLGLKILSVLKSDGNLDVVYDSYEPSEIVKDIIEASHYETGWDAFK